jgi:hypothetical protein
VYVRSVTGWVQQQKLTASDPASGDEFGNVVAIRGDQIAICKPYDGEEAANAGAVCVYSRTGTSWSQTKKLTASDGAVNDVFGTHVAITGNTIVVGAYGDDEAGDFSGLTYIFECSVAGQDITPPTIICPADIVTPTDPGQCSAVVNFIVTATDNSPGVSVVCNPSSGTTFPIGTTTVVCTATDVSGNTATCSFLVTVQDTTAPLPDLATLPTITGQFSATITTATTATDNCSSAIVGTTSDLLSYTAPGTYTVTWTYNDGNGNSSTQTQIVVVGQQLTALGPTQVWIGLKNSDDVGTKFDLLAEAFRNGVPIGSGELDGVSGGSSGFNNAVLMMLPRTVTSMARSAES